MTMDMDLDGGGCNNREATGENSPGCSGYSSMVHSKKVIKHALRQQAKRRRKNTTIAAGNSRTLPRIIVKPLPPPPPDDPPVTNVPHAPIAEEPAVTMREVLASLPGFSLKSGRRRSTKRLSAAAQLEAGLVDLESPTSILANTSLRVLLNRHTFQGLPPLYQRKLAQLLPAVDRQDAATSGLNNEFFARACLEWRKRLTEGEFTPENQQRLKMEAERDKNKLDPWKLKHFEPIWGEKREPKLRSGLHCVAEPRSAGAVTRSCLRLRLESALIHGTTESNSCPSTTVREERVEVDNHSPKPHVNITEDTILASRVTQDNGVTQESEDCTDPVLDETPEQVPNEEKTDTANSENVVKDNSIAEEVETILESKSPDSCRLKSPKEITELPIDDEKNVVNLDIQETAKNEESVVVVPKIEEVEPSTPKQLTTEEDVQITKVEQNSPEESVVSPQDTQDITLSKSIVEEPAITEEVEVGESCSTAEATAPTTAVAEESQIPEEMEIDSETLRRIHELEVRGEMRAAYEEISGCPEEIIYPILESMEIGTSSGGETDTSGLTGQVTVAPVPRELATGNEEDAFIDANNYVLESREIRSEMLDCSWTVDPTVNNSSVSRTHEDLQVPWPLVAAALDGTVAANITVTTQDDCAETLAQTEMIDRVDVIPQISVNPKSSVAEAVNCVQIPVDQTSSYRSDSLMVGTPVTTCLLNRSANSLQPSSESPPIIAFSQLQSIRFVQTSFHPGQTNTETLTDSNTVPLQIQSQSAPSPQLDAIGPQDEIAQIVSTTPTNIVGRATVQTNNVILRGQIPNAPTCVPSPNQARNQNPVSMVQQPTPIAAQPRQIVATVQQQYPPGVTVSSRTARSTGQSGQRGSRGGNKEQGSGRSRSSTKEPPGAVNLERSYQICQAVIQSSPNRDQLKAHLKPPPSLLARADGVFTTSKPGGRSLTAVKTAKSQQTVQHVKQTQNKAQAVMLRHVFATARQAIPTEVTDNGSVAQISTNGGTNGSGQYILVQRTGVGDSAPRASSAPPLPPQIPGMGMGLQLVRGRPASAGEGSHQAVTLKARGASDGRGGGGAEPGAPGVIMGGDPPPPCECNMRGAMVICRQCGAFCHDDCIGPQRICATCLIR